MNLGTVFSRSSRVSYSVRYTVHRRTSSQLPTVSPVRIRFRCESALPCLARSLYSRVADRSFEPDSRLIWLFLEYIFESVFSAFSRSGLRWSRILISFAVSTTLGEIDSASRITIVIQKILYARMLLIEISRQSPSAVQSLDSSIFQPDFRILKKPRFSVEGRTIPVFLLRL